MAIDNPDWSDPALTAPVVAFPQPITGYQPLGVASWFTMWDFGPVNSKLVLDKFTLSCSNVQTASASVGGSVVVRLNNATRLGNINLFIALCNGGPSTIGPFGPIDLWRIALGIGAHSGDDLQLQAIGSDISGTNSPYQTVINGFYYAV